MGALIVGKVGVRIYPDTKGFRGDAKRQLEAETSNLEIGVPVVADSSLAQLKATTLKAVKAMNAIAKLDSRYHVKVPVTVDTRNIMEAARQAASKMNQDLSGVKSKVNIDSSALTSTSDNIKDVRRQLAVVTSGFRDTARSIKEMGEQKIKVGLQGLDREAGKRAFEDLRKGFESGAGGFKVVVHPRVDISTVNASLTAEAVTRALERSIAAAKFEIRPGDAWITRTEKKFGSSMERGFAKAKATSSKWVEDLGVRLRGALADRRMMAEFTGTKTGTLLEMNLRQAIRRGVSAGGDAFEALKPRLHEALSKVQITPSINADHVARQLAQGFRTTKAKITPYLDFASLKAQSLLAKMKAKIPVDFDVRSAAGSVKKALGKVNANIKGKIDMSMDNGVLGRINRVGNEVKKVFNPKNFDLGSATSSLGKGAKFLIRPEMEKGAGAKVMAWFNRLSGIRMGRNLVEDIVGPFKNLDTMIPKLIAFVPAVGAAVAAVISFGGAVLSLGRSVAQILPVVLGLPTVFLGLAASVIPVVFAMKELSTRVPAIGAAFKGLESSMNNNFWSQALAPMQELSRTVIPRIVEGIKTVATSSGSLFGAFATEASTRLPAAFDIFFRGVVGMNEGLKGAAGPITEVLAIFLRMAEWILPAFGNQVAKVATSFAAWLGAAEKTGDLRMWIERGVGELKDLWNVALGVYGVFEALTRPLKELGQMTLGSLAGDLARMRDSIGSATGQVNVSLVFGGARDGIDNLLREAGAGLSSLFNELPQALSSVLPKVGTAFGTLLGALADGLSKVLADPSFLGFFDSLVAVAQTLAPALQPFVAQLGDAIGLVGVMAQAFAPIIAIILGIATEAVGPLKQVIMDLTGGVTSVLSAIAPHVSTIVGSLGQALPQISGALGQALTALAPTFGMWAEGLAQIVGQLLPALAPLLASVIGFIVEMAPAIQFAAVESMKMFQVFASGVTVVLTVVEVIVDAINVLVAAVTGSIGPLGELFQAVFTGQWGKIPEIMGRVKDGVLQNSQAATQALEDSWSRAGEAIDASLTMMDNNSKTKLGEMTNTSAQAGQQIHSSMSASGTSMAAEFDSAMGQMSMSTSDKMLSMRSTVDAAGQGMSASLDGSLSSMSGRVNSEMASMSGYASGNMGKMRSAVSSSASGMASDVKGEFGQMTSGANKETGSMSNSVERETIQGMNRMRSAVRTGVQESVSALSALKGLAAGALGGLGSLLYGAGTSIMSGLLSGIRSQIGALRSLLAEITSLIPANKGPIEVDRKLLTPNGKAIMESLVEGFRLGRKGMVAELQGFTSDITASAFGLPNLAVKASNEWTQDSNLAGPSSNINITNYYPQAEPTSRTVDRALIAAAL